MGCWEYVRQTVISKCSNVIVKRMERFMSQTFLQEIHHREQSLLSPFLPLTLERVGEEGEPVTSPCGVGACATDQLFLPQRKHTPAGPFHNPTLKGTLSKATFFRFWGLCLVVDNPFKWVINTFFSSFFFGEEWLDKPWHKLLNGAKKKILLWKKRKLIHFSSDVFQVCFKDALKYLSQPWGYIFCKDYVMSLTVTALKLKKCISTSRLLPQAPW